MLTPFGKFIRKLRIDQGLLLKNMADALGVTSSYLSAVEMGKKAVPTEWIESIARTFEFDELKRNELTRLAEISKPEFRVSMSSDADELARETVYSFARKAPSLDQETIKKIYDILHKEGI